MYLIDTNVISEVRKKGKANHGVKSFFKIAQQQNIRLYISVITIGELKCGVEIIKHRGDKKQAYQLQNWLESIMQEYAENILDFTGVEAQVWGKLSVPNYGNAIDKQIAATALTYGLTLVTRNIDDFSGTGVSLVNPFE